MKKEKPYDLIMKSIKEKSTLKHDVYDNTFAAFNELKSIAFETIKKIKEDPKQKDDRIAIEYKEKGDFEFEIRISADLLVFVMHSNVFQFAENHNIWNNSYLQKDNLRSYCGQISIYNFLNDSFKYNRYRDLGYLIGRVFINKENHYFVEGKRQLGFLYNDFMHSKITKKAIKNVLESTILYSLNFDLFTQPFDTIKEITVSDIQAVNEMQIKTGKRLGYEFSNDNDDIIG